MQSTALPLLALGTAALAGAGVVAHGTFAPTGGLWGPIVSRGATDGPPRVALTFDDGPTRGGTDRVLDILSELKVKAAFFVIGRNVEREPELVRRIDTEGHLVCNHSFDHSYFGVFRTGRFWQDQVDRTDEAIEKVIGRRPKIFRPPVGIKTPYTMRAIRNRGHALVTWSLRAVDGIPTTQARILHRLIPRCRAGDIVILHDGVDPNLRRDPSPTVAAVRPLIRGLRERGLEAVRLDELTGLTPYAGTGPNLSIPSGS